MRTRGRPQRSATPSSTRSMPPVCCAPSLPQKGGTEVGNVSMTNIPRRSLCSNSRTSPAPPCHSLAHCDPINGCQTFPHDSVVSSPAHEGILHGASWHASIILAQLSDVRSTPGCMLAAECRGCFEHIPHAVEKSGESLFDALASGPAAIPR